MRRGGSDSEKANVIYVKNFSLTEYPDEPAIFDSEETPENVAERKENTETEIEEYAGKRAGKARKYTEV